MRRKRVQAHRTQQHRARWRVLFCLLSSATLHLVFFYVTGGEVSKPTTPSTQPSLTWFEVETPAPPPAATSQPIKPALRPSAAAKAGRRNVETPVALQSVPLPAGPSIRADDRPSVALLTPLSLPLDSVLKVPVAPEQPTGGETLRNEADALPNPKLVAEFRGEVTARTIQSAIQQNLGAARVDVGNVPAYFRRLEKRFRDSQPERSIRPTLSLRDATQRAADGYTGIMESVAASQLPFADPLAPSTGISHGQRLQEASRDLRPPPPRMTAVLLLYFDASGALADAKTSASSTDVGFDESVLHYARKTIRREDDDGKEMGLRGLSWQTHWRFDWNPGVVRVLLLDASPTDGP
jgi:hypothetical protein